MNHGRYNKNQLDEHKGRYFPCSGFAEVKKKNVISECTFQKLDFFFLHCFKRAEGSCSPFGLWCSIITDTMYRCSWYVYKAISVCSLSCAIGKVFINAMHVPSHLHTTHIVGRAMSNEVKHILIQLFFCFTQKENLHGSHFPCPIYKRSLPDNIMYLTALGYRGWCYSAVILNLNTQLIHRKKA